MELGNEDEAVSGQHRWAEVGRCECTVSRRAEREDAVDDE